jgi:hypothetical protein
MVDKKVTLYAEEINKNIFWQKTITTFCSYCCIKQNSTPMEEELGNNEELDYQQNDTFKLIILNFLIKKCFHLKWRLET